ncbi:D-alanyl-D-alanine carboxypeptidase/D-alanyl-D-alanine endopeptidase [Flammeovirga aprica]|uniref:D-alanyl-D-alanine carboxypeptidase/D-alanyl-D-alanine-endopeptidase n=1 Tax=Flammeovirga aprica JL-4 TaxID=694437 RepID=A0A7X9NZH4_9BACT|nr:D-alanyl-D-alanine carboxypeptidase/D-alanyl-D-alanine-endopeptidase [Flammeovirga aprica]NME66388.1 D-alanyl-D-alanine carboxypeptidase/D-alanyl-D-alanine-endopeptidase [Flammeovirga aprica JL-4]
MNTNLIKSSFLTVSKILFFSVILQFLFLQVNAQTKNKMLEGEFQKFLEHEWMKGASVSFHVKSIKGNKFEYGYDAERALTPASITKLLTTSAGLFQLGEDFRFKTKISYTGDFKDGVLDGNLIIHGGGDPTLTLLSLDSAVKASFPSLKEIKGGIIADASLYGTRTTPPNWVWEDLGNYYGVGAASLNINDNMFKLYLKTGATGAVASINKVEPHPPYLHITSEVTAGKKGTGDNSFLFSAPYSDRHIIRGTLPPHRSNFRVKGGVTDPDYHAVWLLADTLSSQGIVVSKENLKVEYQKENVPTSKVAGEINSKPLSWIINRTNKKSINLYAESIAKYVSNEKTRSIVADSITSTLLNELSTIGVTTDGIYLEDGSGLSPFDAFSASHMTSVLEKIYSAPQYKTFYNSLAVTGISGTLKYFCRNNQAKGKVHGKSGSMRRVRSYAGYIKTNGGDELAFTIIVNNFSCKSKVVRKAMEPLFDVLVK